MCSEGCGSQIRVVHLSSIPGRFKLKLRRVASTAMATRPLIMRNEQPLMSFTFDDFPRSALSQGGAILSTYNVRGTFFASLGLMGGVAPTGETFCLEDLQEVIRQKHELGCHTYDHCHAWDTAAATFEASVLRNRSSLRKYLPEVELRTSSYPISCPRPSTKRKMSRYFDCCRGGGQSFNTGSVDLNLAKGFFLEQSRNDFDEIARVIEANNRSKGWLIFVTHDVSDVPTRFGCTPVLFEKVVRHAVRSGVKVLPMCAAVDEVRDGIPR